MVEIFAFWLEIIISRIDFCKFECYLKPYESSILYRSQLFLEKIYYFSFFVKLLMLCDDACLERQH